MSFAKWFLLGWFASSALVTVATIGKARQPLNPVAAAISLLVFAGLSYLVVIA